MPSTLRPVISSDELSDEAMTITTFSNTMSFIRHVMCLAASLPIAFLSKPSVFKAIALLCAMTTFDSFPMTPKTAQVTCTLSFVLSTMLYYINGGIPQNQEDKDIFAVLFILSFSSQKLTPEESTQTKRPKDIFLLCIEKSLLSLVNYFYAIIITGNSLASGLKPEACAFAFLWPWLQNCHYELSNIPTDLPWSVSERSLGSITSNFFNTSDHGMNRGGNRAQVVALTSDFSVTVTFQG
ncbi:hypothetical protein F5Y08DRAFT_334590 [Xylaria arbuscula]|nr:hypothetical protein F5Y08DRAFT_334590 [Xylaria arbuscula]